MEESKPSGWKFRAFAIVCVVTIFIGIPGVVAWKLHENTLSYYFFVKNKDSKLVKLAFRNFPEEIERKFVLFGKYSNENGIDFFSNKSYFDINFNENGVVDLSFSYHDNEWAKIWKIDKYSNNFTLINRDKNLFKNNKNMKQIQESIRARISFTWDGKNITPEKNPIIKDKNINWKSVYSEEEVKRIFRLLEKFRPNWKTNTTWGFSRKIIKEEDSTKIKEFDDAEKRVQPYLYQRDEFMLPILGERREQSQQSNPKSKDVSREPGRL
jgi:hypothetical protein